MNTTMEISDKWQLMIHLGGIENRLGIDRDIVDQLRDRAKERIFPPVDLMIQYLKIACWFY